MTAWLKLLTVSVLLVISACVSAGTKAITDAGVVSQIEVGKSTQADVAALLGYPITASYGGQGEETWHYTWVTVVPHGHRFCARGQSLYPLFGRNHPGVGRDLQPGRHREESGVEPASPRAPRPPVDQVLSTFGLSSPDTDELFSDGHQRGCQVADLGGAMVPMADQS